MPRRKKKKFIKFRFDIKFKVTPKAVFTVGKKKRVIKEEDKIIFEYPTREEALEAMKEFRDMVYNYVIDNLNPDDLRETIAEDPTLAKVAWSARIEPYRRIVSKTLEEFMKENDIQLDVEYEVQPEFAWQDYYAFKRYGWRKTSHKLSGSIPSRIAPSEKIREVTEEHRRLTQ